VAIERFRIDDRLIHGQVVVGWGQPLDVGFIALVDDAVAESDWEQELYRMGVPPEMEVVFANVEGAAQRYALWAGDARPGILLTGDIGTMSRLAEQVPTLRTVNIGGIHHRAGRVQRLRYVFLTPQEEQQLLALQRRGVAISAQDVPAARAVPLDAVLAGQGD
jgi:PTS system mannose-specific IIB component/fructoselysine and glucoselysine-specific PTS system IIB component